MRFCFHFIAVIGCLNQIYLRNKRRFTINFFYCFTDKSEYNESYGDCMVNTGKQSIQNTVAKIGAIPNCRQYSTAQQSTTQKRRQRLQFNSGKKADTAKNITQLEITHIETDTEKRSGR